MRAFLMRSIALTALPLAAACTSFNFGAGGGSTDSPSATSQENEQRGGRGGRSGSGRSETATEIKDYDEVITKEAKTDDGVFKVHRIKEKVFYEIPASELGVEFLWVTQIAKTTAGAGYGGQSAGNRVVKWDRHGDRILLKSVNYSIVADPELPIARAVDAANQDAIVRAFDIEALGEGDAPVIDVTELFTTDISEFSVRQRLGRGSLDSRRSFVEATLAFPTNIEVRATHTFNPGSGGGETGGARGGRGGRGGGGSGTASVLMHFSMVKLPAEPMMPRRFDERVGYFSIRHLDYGVDEARSVERRYITKWRLEKADPTAEVSEPVAPIVYYVDPATPEKWRPYVKAGIEQWQPAFEAAGFRNAIIGKYAPTPEEDPEWHPEDARYSVIRWLPSTTQNASGPHVHDPRTGEILESDIQLHHNVLNLGRNWYFSQASPLDRRAQRIPMPDDLMGKLLEYVVAHEVGHTLGFQHNMKASSTYTVAEVRDPNFVRTMGHTPTLMDYSRFNYVAQPEDGFTPDLLIPIVGPYDKWATMWGYKPIPSATAPDEELATLNGWALEQNDKPYLRFSTAGASGSDPGDQTEAVGDADAVEATRLGIKNIERVAGYLLDATTTRQGQPFDDLQELYGNVVGQWSRELSHVTSIVGGHYSQQKHIGQEGVRFTPVENERQAAAVAFLNANAFKTPRFLTNKEILRRLEPSGQIDRIGGNQRRVLSSLLSNARIARLVESEALDGDAAYRPTDFLAEVRRGVFEELNGAQVAIDAFRRNLQRGYVETMAEKISGAAPATDDARALARAELIDLDRQISRVLSRAADRATNAHLADLRIEISKALDPRNMPAVDSNQGASGSGASRIYDPSDPTAPLICWPDYDSIPPGR